MMTTICLNCLELDTWHDPRECVGHCVVSQTYKNDDYDNFYHIDDDDDGLSQKYLDNDDDNDDDDYYHIDDDDDEKKMH